MTDPPPTIVPIKIKRDIADQLRHEAKRRGLKPSDLASQIVSDVTEHDLFLAVLDSPRR